MYINDILDYIDTDLICYRAENPKELVKLQKNKWDPIILLIEKYIGTKVHVFEGVLPKKQHATVHDRLNNLINQFDIFEISVLHRITNITGSIFLSLCVLKKDISKNEVFKNGDLVTIDFDGAVVQIIDNENFSFQGRVLHSGSIGNNKGINVDRSIKLNRFTLKDEKAFSLCQEIGLDHIFLSFCSHESDVEELRKRFSYEINIISKIESKNGLMNLDGICKKSNALLIDRGDLSREVPLEKIPLAQNQILEKSKKFDIPVYVATNLMENMILNSKPTRAEVNDIQSTLNNGAKGLVLAAETAIGKYPIDCVRIMSRIIFETINHKYDTKSIQNLFNPSFGRIIEPHGGKLVQQFSNDQSDHPICEVEVNEKIYTDSFQIANGTFSPLNAFMNYEQIESVLNENLIKGSVAWTMPIIFQIDKDIVNKIPDSGSIYLKKENELSSNLKSSVTDNNGNIYNLDKFL